MAYRKFFAGDVVRISADKYGRHIGHTGVITGATIYRDQFKKARRVRYNMGCSCGSSLRPAAWCMELLSTPPKDATLKPEIETRRSYFLRMVHQMPNGSKSLGLEDHYSSGVTHTPGMTVFLHQFTEETDMKRVEDLLEVLPPRERTVLTSRFGLNDTPAQTLGAIGEAMDLSRQRIHMIEVAALKRIRQYLGVHDGVR